jgi:Nucleoside-diphosphate-sugar epimerases
MKILVTGSTGFIGSHLIEELSKQGLALRAAYRPGDNFQFIDSDFLIDGLDLESFPLELSDARSVAKAVAGCQIVFHTEHLFSYSERDKARLYAINQQGTRNVMEACLAAGVERVVYTSGMETLRAAEGQDFTRESDGVALEELSSSFEKSRYLAEREVMRLKNQGLPVTIVHPTVCVGKRDRGSTPFGRYLRRYLQGKIHFYLDTGLNLIDVVDVAKGHLLAAKRGEPGARYILGHQNIYMLEILRNLQRLSGVAPPKTALPPFFAKLGNAFARNILQRREGIPNALIDRLRRPLFFDSQLAKQQLGLPQSNVWEAVRREIADLHKNP